MQYELECGHCGYQFVLDVVALPRTTKCTVCGGLLTLAVPVAVVPPPAPPEPPAKPKPISPPDAPPKTRTRHLAEPWPGVRSALNNAARAVDLTRALFVLFLVLTFLAMWLVPEAKRTEGDW